jgi:hypothetical protein
MTGYLHVKSPVDEMLELRSRSVPTIVRAVERIAEGYAAGDSEELWYATRSLANILAGAQGLADLMGRRRLLLEHDAALSKHKGKRFDPIMAILRTAPRGPTPLQPDVTFHEAVEDLVKREPRLARSAEEVAQLYSTEHVFAMARSSSKTITERVQAILSKAFEEGEGTELTIQRIARENIGPFAQSYAEVVYRTSLATSYAAGRERQVEDPDVAEVILGFRFETAGDSHVRNGTVGPVFENHKALEGLIAPTRSPIWYDWSPPLGYQDRCEKTMVDRFEAADNGWLERDGKTLRTILPPGFASAKRHPSFTGSRATLLAYRGSVS